MSLLSKKLPFKLYTTRGNASPSGLYPLSWKTGVEEDAAAPWDKRRLLGEADWTVGDLEAAQSSS